MNNSSRVNNTSELVIGITRSRPFLEKKKLRKRRRKKKKGRNKRRRERRGGRRSNTEVIYHGAEAEQDREQRKESVY